MTEITMNEIETQLEYIKRMEIEKGKKINSLHKNTIIKLCNKYDAFKDTMEYKPLLTKSIRKFVLS